MKSKKDDEMEKWENEVLKDASNQAVLAGTTTLASKKASPAPQKQEEEEPDEEEKTKNTRAFEDSPYN